MSIDDGFECQHKPGKEVSLPRVEASQSGRFVMAFVCKRCGVLYVPEGDREDPTSA